MNGRLLFVDDRMPGITRRRLQRGERLAWAYFDADGARIKDREEIDRLNAIALPPAYEEAWFCPDAQGHLLATGIDARGRRQYRYNPAYRLSRECLKYDALTEFGRALPAIRARVERDLAARGLTRARAIASVVRLLDCGAIRIGNEAYARTNKSFGATTLRMRHAQLGAKQLRLRFKAKSGKARELIVTDRSLLRFVKAMQDLPGQHLFQFLDEEGHPAPVGSADVNAYLRDAADADISAKHFRTWWASVIAFEAIATAEAPMPLKAVLALVSERLGNTPAIARKSYVHPALLALAGDPAAQEKLGAKGPLPRRTHYLSRAERGLLAFLDHAPAAAKLLVA
jgi:DNA topoisomerase-1